MSSAPLKVGDKVHCNIRMTSGDPMDAMGEVGTIIEIESGRCRVRLHPCGDVINVLAVLLSTCEWDVTHTSECPG